MTKNLLDNISSCILRVILSNLERRLTIVEKKLGISCSERIFIDAKEERFILSK